MKTFPYKILFLCIFLPPVCYILTLQGLEGYLQQRVTTQVNKTLIQNDQALYEGLVSIRDEINRNIDKYLTHNLLTRIGVHLNILIKTGDNRILYPAPFNLDMNSRNYAGRFDKSSEQAINYYDIAKENYDILSSGIIPAVDVKVSHNSWLSNSILVFYIFVSVYILQRFIRKNIRESEKYDSDQRELIQKLSTELSRAETTLEDVKFKENEYQQKVSILNSDKHQLSRDIDGLLEEMESLEEGLTSQKELREKTEQEVSKLTEELDQLRERLKKGKKKNKKQDIIEKRFKVLYKNLYLSDKALQGFISLTDEFQLKAEEIIHRLNEDDSRVPVKRKVFSKGGKINVLEVDFSYSGRLYFKKDEHGKIAVLAIGNKNTQDQDLNYLENEC